MASALQSHLKMNSNKPNFARAWRRPSAFFSIGEVPEEDEDVYNEFDSDEDIPGPNKIFRRRSSVPFLYSSNSSLESDAGLGWELAEKRKYRKPSVIPMNQGLQQWVDLKQESNDKQLAVGGVGKKKKATYDDIKEFLDCGKIKDAKTAVRDSDWDISSDIRSRLWPTLASVHEAIRTSHDGLYWETVSQIFGSHETPEETSLPGFVENKHQHYYKLSPEGIRFCNRLIAVVGYSYPDITYCPLVLPLTSLMIHYTQEEKAFTAINTLIQSKYKVFLTQTKLQWEVTCLTAMHLTKKFSKPAFTFVSRNLKPGEKAETVFCGWMWWIFRDLPISHLVRVVDCFMIEGVKVLYRVAIAILLSFTKACNSDSKWSNLVETSGLDSAISSFCSNIAELLTPQRLLKSAFAIRAFRGSEIRKISTKVELLLKSKSGHAGGQMQRSKSDENLPSSQSQMDIQMMSHTLIIQELLALWNWLPIRITMYQPVLLYTTEEHGCSLTTFFSRVEAHEPTILIIKTTSDEVFGAYCSTHWGARNEKDEKGDRQRYFGTGETFLFSLKPERKKYPWVGIKPRIIEADENEDPAETKKLGRGDELFMHADTHMISIGGGDGQGICLDENLRFGKTEHCTTFQNPPLATVKDFEVSVLEVIGFTCA